MPALIVGGLILLLLVFAYAPSLSGGFLWDDDGHVTRADLRSIAGLGRIWGEVGATQQYYPLLHSTFWIQQALWGDWAPGYRLVNLLFHAGACTLLVLVLRRLELRGALFAGLVFALHPVHVESVAWISEQKNTLSAVFYLGAALAWLRYENDRRFSRYVVASLLFVAALLTKTVTATLPAALWVVAWWRRGRLPWRHDILPLLPWLVLGAGAGLFTAWFEHTGIGAQGGDFDLGLVERGLLAGRIFWFYPGKLVWPAELVFHYPRWTIDGGALWQYVFPLAALVLVGVAAGWARRQRGPLAAVLLFVGTLFPVLGFVNVYPFVFSYVADHFQYLASVPVIVLIVAGGANDAAWRRIGLAAGHARVFAGAILLLLGLLAWRQSRDYVDPITLYRATLARNPGSWVAHHNLALELAHAGEVESALPHARRAVALKPDFAEALNNLADYLVRTGSPAEAPPLLQRALELQPRYAQAENTWGTALAQLGRVEEGMDRFQRAIALEPRLAEGHYNLGLAQCARCDFAAAIPHFAETVRLRPDHAGAELNWGVALAMGNRVAEAQPHFARALALDPESGALRQTYGRVLLGVGDFRAAVDVLYAALRLEPELPGLHRDLAFALEKLGRFDDARYHAAEANRRP